MPRPAANIPPPVLVRAEPIMVDRDAGAAMLGLPRSTFEQYVTQGLLPKPRGLGKHARWLVNDLQATAHALPVSDKLPPPRGKKEGATC